MTVNVPHGTALVVFREIIVEGLNGMNMITANGADRERPGGERGVHVYQVIRPQVSAALANTVHNARDGRCGRESAVTLADGGGILQNLFVICDTAEIISRQFVDHTEKANAANEAISTRLATVRRTERLLCPGPVVVVEYKVCPLLMRVEASDEGPLW